MMLKPFRAIISRIRRTWERNGLTGFLLAGFRRIVLGIAGLILPVDVYNQLETFFLLGYFPSLKNPQTFNEKILWRKVRDNNPLFPIVADKFRVRDYVAERVGKEVLIELYYVTDKPETIPFTSLPDSFVVKANFGARRYIIVNDKKSLKQEAIIRRCQEWLKEKGNNRFDKWQLHNIPRVIMVEEMLKEPGRDFPIDYKFYCFQGRIRMIEVAYKDRRNLYDENKQLLDVVWNNVSKGLPDFRFPDGFERMEKVAELLSADFDFVSVDLYYVNGACKFGELSLFPEGGYGRFAPDSFDLWLGSFWKIG